MLIKIQNFYLYFLLINITTAANGWSILGLPIGQLIYWFLLFLSIFVLYNTKYFNLGFCLVFMTLVLNVCDAFIGIPLTGTISEFTSGLTFVLVGANLYGRNPNVIYKQLLIFFTLSIPFMIIQKIGVHVFFYGWSTEIFHENGIYSFDSIKDRGVLLKNIPLFPTLFTELKDLVYVMYQGRPTGLLYSNNVLSIFISFSLALHFSINHNIKRNLKYLIISSIIVLTASTLVYGVLILLFVYFYFFKEDKGLKSNALKTLLITFIMLFFHFIFFPGFTINGFGEKNLLSFVFRFGEIFNALGLNYLDELIVLYNFKIAVDNEESYSLIGALFKNKFMYLFIFLSFIFLFIYFKSLKLNKKQSLVYIVLFTICILTQFSTNFLLAPSFQLFLGIAFFPLIQRKMFRTIM